MKNGTKIVIALLIAGGVLFSLFARNLSAFSTGDGRSLRWARYDVTIDNVDTSANRYNVTESYVLDIETGPYSFGFAEIPLKRTENIDNVTVTDAGTALTPGCIDVAGYYCVINDGKWLSIKYFFRSQAQSGQTRTIDIRYTVYGGLRSYEDGDQLYWVAIPGDRAFPIDEALVTVNMPDGTPIDKTASYPDTWKEDVQGSTITWKSPGVMEKGDELEVRVQYPHNPQMDKPDWQGGYDRERFYVENIQPIISLILVILGALIGIGTVALVLVRFMTRGRDPQALVAPEFLTELPDEELPAVIGLLLDEKFDMRDMMATLVDLARRGFLVIEQKDKEGVFGMFGSTEFVFHNTKNFSSPLTNFERELMAGIFGPAYGKEEVELSDLKEKFYKKIPTIKKAMYQELIARGYFEKSPDQTRQRWYTLGVVGLVVGFLGIWFSDTLSFISPLIMAPAVGVVIGSAAAFLFADVMPAKTQKGSQVATNWRAFRKYLDDIEKHSDMQQVSDKFDQFIPYAVMFGIEQDIIKRFANVLTAMPTWYYPTSIGGPWGRGYRHNPTPMTGMGKAVPMSGMNDMGGGFGGLNDMSQSMSQGLNSMSSGLTRMLNDASRTMTSTPKSSSSGGGFSGGGSRGGGGGGGGSRGFG